MTVIQRWYASDIGGMFPTQQPVRTDNDWVRYTDHLAAVNETEQNMWGKVNDAQIMFYESGRADGIEDGIAEVLNRLGEDIEDRIRREQSENDADGLIAGLCYALTMVTRLFDELEPAAHTEQQTEAP